MEIFGLGTSEILLILVVILLLFGKDKLPELARSVGKSFKELKAGFEKSTDLGDMTLKDSKELGVEEKAKEIERQRHHLAQMEGDLEKMKKGTTDSARKHTHG